MKFFRWTAATVGALIALGGCMTHRAAIDPSVRSGIATGFINKTMVVDGNPRRYVVYVPREYDPAQTWPLIVFLHGAGERGDDGLAQTEVGIGTAIRRHADRFPCLVLMPQCPDSVKIPDNPNPKEIEKVIGKILCEFMDHIETAYDQTLKNYSVDPSRVYLTGISMGGFGTWILGARHHDRYAAIMPICGGGLKDDASKLATLPVWAFHGTDDSVVPADESRKMVKAVREAGGKVQYTEFPGVDHNSWDPAYDDEKAIRWLLNQKKR